MSGRFNLLQRNVIYGSDVEVGAWSRAVGKSCRPV